MRKTILYFIYFLLINVDISFCQDLKIRFMDGVYDLDNDDLDNDDLDSDNLDDNNIIANDDLDKKTTPDDDFSWDAL